MKAQSKAGEDLSRKLKANEDLQRYFGDLAGGEARRRATHGNLLLEDPNRVGPAHAGHSNVKELSFSGYERNPVFYNDGGKFVDIGGATGAAMLDDGRGVVAADLDGDGDDDLALRNVFIPHLVLFRNDVAREAQLVVKLKGTKTNRFGIGAKITVKAGDLVRAQEVACGAGYLSAGPPECHFGLGGRRARVEVRWPSGETKAVEDVGPGTLEVAEDGTTTFVPAAGRVTHLPNPTPRLVRAGDDAVIDAIGADGKALNLAALKGRTVVVHVWSVRCLSCREEIKRFGEFAAALKAAGIEFVSLNVDQTRAHFADRVPPGVPVWILKGPPERWLPAAEPTLPLHIIIGPDGKVVDRLVGAMEPAELVEAARR